MPAEAGQPEATPVQTAASRYDLGDTGFDAELDTPSHEKPRAAVETKPAVVGPKAETPAAPDTPKHSPRLVDRALDVGIDQATIDRLGSDQLDDLVYHVNKTILRERRQDSKAQTVEENTGRRPEAKQSAGTEPATGKDALPTAPADDEYDFGEDEALLDPEFSKLMKKHLGKQQKLIKELQGKLGQVEEVEKRRKNESVNNYVDRLFAGLGAGYEPQFGKGRRADLIGTAELKRRVAVVTLAEGMTEGKDFAEKFALAVETLYGKRAPAEPEAGDEGSAAAEYAKPAAPRAANGRYAAPEQEVAARKAAYAQNGLVRPTNRTTELPPGTRKAEQTASRIMKERGLSGDDDDDFFDGIPG